MRRFSRQQNALRWIGLMIAALVCTLIISTPTPTAAAYPTPTAKNVSSLTAQAVPLFAKTATGAKVSVIVGLNTPFDASNAATAQGQLPTIQSTRARLIQRMTSSGARTLSTDWVIPFAAFEVDGAGLTALINSPEVISLQENKLNHIADNASDNLIGAPTAWVQNKTGNGQYVAILDTGVQASHPFFGGRVTAEACFSGSVGGSATLCPNGLTSQSGVGAAAPCGLSGCEHGTHVAGIAAGDGRSISVAQAGVAVGADVLAVQVFSRIGSAIGAYDSDILNGLNYVYQFNKSYFVSAVNLSLGADDLNATYCDSALPSYKSIIDLLRSVSIATVVASGNDSYTTGISSPACISSAISVGATNFSDVVASFSNSYSLLTLLAPGVNVYSSFPGSTYGYDSGTSMATPQVVGAIAILKQQMPDATVSQIIRALQNTGPRITDSRNNVTTTRIRVDNALAAIVTARTKHVGFYDRQNFTFYLKNTNATGNGNADIQVTHGYANTFPITGDWNGDGIDTVGTYDQTNGVFVLWDSNVQGAGYSQAFVFGNPNDRPLSGRWVDGTPNDPVGHPHDGVGVFRPSNGLIYLITAWPQPPSTTVYADYTIVLGNPNWVGVAGHWYGASLDTAGVYDPSVGRFYLTSLSCNGIAPGPNVFCLQYSTSNQLFGAPGSIPFAGDWFGTGQSGLGVYEVNQARFSLLNYVSTTDPISPPPAQPPDAQFVFGVAGGNKVPLAGHWVMGVQPSTTGKREGAPPLDLGSVIVGKPTTPVPITGDGQPGHFD